MIQTWAERRRKDKAACRPLFHICQPHFCVAFGMLLQAKERLSGAANLVIQLCSSLSTKALLMFMYWGAGMMIHTGMQICSNIEHLEHFIRTNWRCSSSSARYVKYGWLDAWIRTARVRLFFLSCHERWDGSQSLPTSQKLSSMLASIFSKELKSILHYREQIHLENLWALSMTFIMLWLHNGESMHLTGSTLVFLVANFGSPQVATWNSLS